MNGWINSADLARSALAVERTVRYEPWRSMSVGVSSGQLRTAWGTRDASLVVQGRMAYEGEAFGRGAISIVEWIHAAALLTEEHKTAQGKIDVSAGDGSITMRSGSRKVILAMEPGGKEDDGFARHHSTKGATLRIPRTGAVLFCAMLRLCAGAHSLDSVMRLRCPGTMLNIERKAGLEITEATMVFEEATISRRASEYGTSEVVYLGGRNMHLGASIGELEREPVEVGYDRERGCGWVRSESHCVSERIGQSRCRHEAWMADEEWNGTKVADVASAPLRVAVHEIRAMMGATGGERIAMEPGEGWVAIVPGQDNLRKLGFEIRIEGAWEDPGRTGIEVPISALMTASAHCAGGLGIWADPADTIELRPEGGEAPPQSRIRIRIGRGE